jgi:hypothetical protein
MYNFIRKNNKKLLAVFAAFLMIVFILPVGMGQMGGHDPVAGRVGGETVMLSQIVPYEAQAEEIRRLMEGGAPIGVAFTLQQVLPFSLQRTLREHPEAFYLLAKEAEEMGVNASAEEVRQFVDFLQLPPTLPRERRAVIEQAIHNLLRVLGAVDRVGTAVKVSEPMIEHARARLYQRIKLNLVEFKTEDFAGKVPAPTTQQVEEQFNAYADLSPDEADPEKNPFRFGYRYPNRLKVQYVMVPFSEVLAAARKSKSDYDWTVAAQKEYKTNPARYASTQPTPESLTLDVSPATAPTTAPAGPTTRPFAEVRDDIVDRLVAEHARQLQNRVITKTTALLNADWVAYQKDPNKPSSLGVPYNSFDYLRKLSESLSKEFGVMVAIESMGQLRSSQEIGSSTDLRIGNATLNGQISFADYAFGAAEALLPEDQRKQSMALAEWEPSQVLRDERDNAYVFQLTEVSPSHKPAGLDEVREKVVQDVQKRLAYEAATEAGEALLKAARTSGLASAAAEAGRSVVATDFFDHGQMTPYGQLPPIVTGYEVPTGALLRFVQQAYDLLRDATEQNLTAAGLIKLQPEGRLIVAELAGVEPSPSAGDPVSVQVELARQLQEQQLREFRETWFQYDAITARTGWTPEKQSEAQPEKAPAPPRNPPFGL